MKSWWNPPFDIQEPRISNALDPFRAIFILYLLRNDIESRKRLDTVLRWYGYEWRRFLLFRICWEKSSSVCPSASLGTMPFPKERIQSWNRERGTTDVKKRGRIPPSLFVIRNFPVFIVSADTGRNDHRVLLWKKAAQLPYRVRWFLPAYFLPRHRGRVDDLPRPYISGLLCLCRK